MKLKVLAGAREGMEIPLKKPEFLIGRTRECALRAGSDAISRRHCAIRTSKSGVTIEDLGSRNGTIVNDLAISEVTSLSDGDTIRVGPLVFLYEGAKDIDRSKKPKVQDVAEAVERTARQSSDDVAEDDISRWLLGTTPHGSPATKETMTFRMDETQAMGLGAKAKESEGSTVSEGGDHLDGESENECPEEANPSEETGKEGEKKKPGKLPRIPKKPGAKDSREAAADVLRHLSRRR